MVNGQRHRLFATPGAKPGNQIHLSTPQNQLHQIVNHCITVAADGKLTSKIRLHDEPDWLVT